MKETDFKKNVLSIIGVLTLLILIGGISYAAFNYIGTSSNNNTLKTGQITMSYTEPTNAMILNNALPTADVVGKATASYFEFSVASHAQTNANDNDGVVIPYEININSKTIDGDKLQLPENKIKLYLVKVENSIEIPVMEPTLISSLTASQISGGDTKVYDTEEVYKNGAAARTTTYRLRAWIDNSFDISLTEENTYQYKFTVNINSQSVYVGPPVNTVIYTPEYCFDYTTVSSSSKITNYKCFDGNTFGLETITDVVIPTRLGDKPVTEIGYSYNYTEEVFYNKGLTSVILPDTLITIGEWAFHYNKLTNVTIPNSVNTIESRAFNGNQLTNVNLGSNVVIIGERAFSYNFLTSVDIPDSVETIDSMAFLMTEPESNLQLRSIINRTGRSFDWNGILTFTSESSFVTGIVNTSYGDVTVSAS